jgi:hypothetical protein
MPHVGMVAADTHVPASIGWFCSCVDQIVFPLQLSSYFLDDQT